MNGRNRMWTLGVVLALGVATTGHAQIRDGSRIFDRMDGNSDGVIDAAELRALREQAFSRLDGDGDGVITAAERERARARGQRMRERMQGRTDEIAAQADTNQDGDISHDEFMAAPRPLMSRADADGDGRITREEFSAVVGSIRELRRQ